MNSLLQTSQFLPLFPSLSCIACTTTLLGTSWYLFLFAQHAQVQHNPFFWYLNPAWRAFLFNFMSVFTCTVTWVVQVTNFHIMCKYQIIWPHSPSGVCAYAILYLILARVLSCSPHNVLHSPALVPLKWPCMRRKDSPCCSLAKLNSVVYIPSIHKFICHWACLYTIHSYIYLSNVHYREACERLTTRMGRSPPMKQPHA